MDKDASRPDAIRLGVIAAPAAAPRLQAPNRLGVSISGAITSATFAANPISMLRAG